jgi:hypothetical protein
MDINTLAAWGEFIGGFAVVISLVYLASQIRQNSRQMRAATGTAASLVIRRSFSRVAALSRGTPSKLTQPTVITLGRDALSMVCSGMSPSTMSW